MKNLAICVFSCILLAGLGFVTSERIDPSGLARGRGDSETPTDSAFSERDTRAVWSQMHQHMIHIDADVVDALVKTAKMRKALAEGTLLTEENLQFVTSLSPMNPLLGVHGKTEDKSKYVDEVIGRLHAQYHNVTFALDSVEETTKHDRLKFQTKNDIESERIFSLHLRTRPDFVGGAYYIVRLIVSPDQHLVHTTKLTMKTTFDTDELQAGDTIAELSYTKEQFGEKLSLLSPPIEFSKKPDGEALGKSYFIKVHAGGTDGPDYAPFPSGSGYIRSVEIYRVLY